MESTHLEVITSMTATRLYQNLGEKASVMFFYDVKNARLVPCYDGNHLTHREPFIDIVDFGRFVDTAEPLMKPGQDVMWVMVGRTETNLAKIRKQLAKSKLQSDMFYFCYNTKQMKQYGHFVRQRGVANSKSLELALYIYKGRKPKNYPKYRKYVDAGTSLFLEVVKNVPVLHPKNHAYVCRQVRESSLTSMIGIPRDQDDDEKQKTQQAEADEADKGLNQPVDADNGVEKERVASQIKKRKVYREFVATDLPWFPHDNDMDMLKELCWEAGNPRWVFHGTPAGGAGVQGCLEVGCSVVLLCFDEHHRKELQKHLLERSVEAMVSGKSLVFKNAELQARSVHLNLMAPPKALPATAKPEGDPEEKKAKKRDPEGDLKEEKGKEHNGKSEKKEDKSEKKSDSESSSSSNSSSESPPQKKNRKKAAQTRSWSLVVSCLPQPCPTRPQS